MSINSHMCMLLTFNPSLMFHLTESPAVPEEDEDHSEDNDSYVSDKVSNLRTLNSHMRKTKNISYRAGHTKEINLSCL